ncbi:hypothetical protein ACLMAL_31525 [Nocardia sp. CWNU-33]|uniref:hypothetical protein n=1 Tax=Nocardia sp. CWNU-33 TaxID=3392117 RepID=UPI00398E9BD4
MIHGVRLHNGRAEWYRNRWVKTPFLEGVPFTGVELPRRVPAGIHGHWIADQEGFL